jgi:hypothetical protein
MTSQTTTPTTSGQPDQLTDAELESVSGGFTPVPIPKVAMTGDVAFTPVPIPRTADVAFNLVPIPGTAGAPSPIASPTVRPRF